MRAKVNHEDIEAAALKSVQGGGKIEKVGVELGGAILAAAVHHDDGLRAARAGNPPSGDFDFFVA